MHILVLDSIHGGREIGRAYHEAGHSADVVDVYRGTTPDILSAARHRNYDLIVAPVHLDPGHPLLTPRDIPVITHHEAVRQLIGTTKPSLFIEITGARGKTTTAHALAHILTGPGLLHTSAGTYAYPEKTLLWKRSITPASLLPAIRDANRLQGWLVAEESLGITGAGDLGIITSPDTYACASGKKQALDEKVASAARIKRLLVADGVSCEYPHAISLSDIASRNGNECTVRGEGGRYVVKNPLLLLPPYRLPLMLAAGAAALLGIDPAPLSTFTALPGRLFVCRDQGRIIVDNANSGANEETALCASRYARHCSPGNDLTLVIGKAERDGAVCEGFTPSRIAAAILKIKPSHVIWVGSPPDPAMGSFRAISERIVAVCPTLDEARNAALEKNTRGPVVLAVKTWR